MREKGLGKELFPQIMDDAADALGKGIARRRPFTDADKEALIAAYEEGYNPGAVARAVPVPDLGESETRIWRTWYLESRAALSEGFCPNHKVPLTGKNRDFCAIQERGQDSWWHLCPQPDDPENPIVIQQYRCLFYLFPHQPNPCEGCGKVYEL